MANEISIVLTQKGFFAGKKLKNGTLALGAHKISEEEILTMATTIMRTYAAKTGEDTLILPGGDGKLVVMKLVEVKAEEPREAPAAAGPTPKKKRTRKAKAE